MAAGINFMTARRGQVAHCRRITLRADISHHGCDTHQRGRRPPRGVISLPPKHPHQSEFEAPAERAYSCVNGSPQSSFRRRPRIKYKFAFGIEPDLVGNIMCSNMRVRDAPRNKTVDIAPGHHEIRVPICENPPPASIPKMLSTSWRRQSATGKPK